MDNCCFIPASNFRLSLVNNDINRFFVVSHLAIVHCKLSIRLVFLTFLTIIGVGSMLAHVVFLNEQRIHGQVEVHRECHESHFGALFHHLGVVNGIVGRCAPREWTVVLHQDGGCVVGIDFADVQDLVHDDISCLQLILSFHLSLSHVARAGNVLVEIVGMGGANVRNVLASLSEGGGIGGVGVYHALDVGECLI